MKNIISVVILIALPILSNAQSHIKNVHLEKTTGSITLDGILNEQAWKDAKPLESFLNKWPIDEGMAENQTSVYLTYDNDNLYLASISFQKENDIVVQSLKRDIPDYSYNSEVIFIGLDPFNNKLSGFGFFVSAANVQSECSIIRDESRSSCDFNWNTAWESKVSVHPNYWVSEIKIPLKSISYDPENNTWGINILRKDMDLGVWSSWNHIPIAFNIFELGYYAEMSFSDDLMPSKRRIITQPYFSSSINEDTRTNDTYDYSTKIGLDSKIPISSSINLDLTLNPDFSTIEVDQQVLNLTRFSIFFPEKRPFFLENNDLFSSFGTYQIRPFFSRQIGINNGQLIPILFGGKVTGNLSSNTRFGFLNAQTRSNSTLSANNYTVATIQQTINERINVKSLITNRFQIEENKPNLNNFDRNIGSEINYTSKNSYFNGNGRIHWSQTQNKQDDSFFAGATLQFNNGSYALSSTYDYVGENYINDLGFVQRAFQYDAAKDSLIKVGFHYLRSSFTKIYRPSINWVNQLNIGVSTIQAWDLNQIKTDEIYSLYTNLFTKDYGSIDLTLNNETIQLLYPTNLIGGSQLLPPETYSFSSISFSYNNDSRNIITWGTNTTIGGFYNGTRYGFGGNINFRTQPWGNFGIRYIANKISLPKDYGKDTIHLFGPSAEINFSTTLSLTTFLQYNTQIQNFNINSRIQWRYAPMSDIYLVYSDNYNTADFSPKNRGIVLKINYWLS